MPSSSDKDFEKLKNEAVDVADHHRSGYYGRDEAMADLARRCPGFTNAEYETAFLQGLKVTR